MKIVHISTTDNRGGAAQNARILHTELNKIPGIESRMLVREKNTDDPLVQTFGITGWKRWLSIATAHNHTFLGGSKLLQHPWIQEADIIHLHNLHGYYFHLPILRELAKTKKVIWTLHDMWTMTGHCGTSLCKNPNADGLYPCQGQFEYEPILWPRSQALGRSKKSIISGLPITYVTPSEWLKNKTEKSYLSKIRPLRIPYGLDTSVFYNQKNEKSEILKGLGIPPDRKILLFIANSFSDPVKGASTLKQILEDGRLKHLQFIAIGNGKLPAHTHLLHVPYIRQKSELAKYYTIADTLLYPALSDNFPSVVLESLLTGTPVVAYDVGGLKEQIRDNIDGRIVPSDNYEAFVKSIFEVLEEMPNLQEISSRALKEFSTKTLIDGYLNLYKKVLLP